MKNRKLFAIITLVAFMLTMMPMMAFATTASGSSISVEDASAKVATTETIAAEKADYLELTLDLDGAIGANEFVIVFAERNGTLSDVDYFHANKEDAEKHLIGDAGDAKAAGYFALVNEKTTPGHRNSTAKAKDGGEISLYVTSETAGNVTFKAYVIGEAFDEGQNVATYYNGSSDFLKTALVGNGCTGKFTTTNNTITAELTVDGSNLGTVNGNTTVEVAGSKAANNGVAYYDVSMKFAQGGSKMVGEDVTISVDKNGATVNKEEATTSATGKIDFKVSASKAGTYTVTVECGTFAQDIEFTFGAAQISKAEFSFTVDGTIAVDAQEKVAMQVRAYDSNGNVLPASETNKGEINDNFTVEVISAPEDSAMEEDELTVEYNTTDSDNLFISFTPDAVGTYTIKIYNDTTGVADTTTITAAEFGTIDHATISYPSNTYALGSKTPGATVNLYDQNGVKKSATGKKFSYTGLGIADFDGTNGAITFKDDSAYAGNEITISVVANNKYAASTTLTIGAAPASLEFTTANGQVGEEVTVNAQVVDVNGNPTAISNVTNYYDVSLESAIIIERPAGATVSVDADYFEDFTETFLKKGTGKVVLTSNKEGTVKANVVVKLDPTDAALAVNEDLTVVYLTGVATATFGENVADPGDANDVVTFIIGSSTFIANDKALTSDVAPYIVDGRTFIPVRAFVEATGASVEYDAATQVVTIAGEGIDAQMTIGSNILTVNGETIVMDTAAQIKDGRTVLPIRYAGQAIGYDFECAYGADG